MKKNLILFCFAIFCHIFGFSQKQPEDVVRNYAQCLNTWFNTRNFKYANEIERLSSGRSFRVNDRIIFDYARRKGMPMLEHYDIDDHIMCLKDVLIGNKINLQISNISRQYNVSYSDDNSRKLYYVSCSVNADGASALSGQELFYIRKFDGKIVKIGPYKEMTNQKTGEKEVVIETSDIDWDGIAAGEYNSLEVSYGYSSNFPLNVGVTTNISYFNIGLEYGMNFSDEQLFYKEHTNFATSSFERCKYWYLMATPGVFLRYASIDCGLGNVFAKFKYDYQSVYTSSSVDEKKYYFVMKPKLTLHIPIPLDFTSNNEQLYISPHIGYQYVPKYSTLNCWEVGIGIRFRFRTY